MKICPKCQRTFDDITKYCSDDGASLSYGPPTTDAGMATAALGDEGHPASAQLAENRVEALQKDLEKKLENFETSQRKTRKVSGILLVLSLVSSGVYWMVRYGNRAPLNRPVVSYTNTTTSASGVKLDVDSKPGERVTVSQAPFKLLQPLLVGGKQVDGENSIELKNFAGYAPGPPTCEPDSIDMSIIHRKASLSGWQFPAKAKILFIVDGVEMKPTPNALADLFESTNSAPKGPAEDHGQYVETRVVKPTCEILQKVGSSRSVQIRIGNASVDLSDSDRATIKDFAVAIGLK